jgi:MFS family permease
VLLLRRISLTTFLNFFVSGAITLIIPLLLLERNVSVNEIGIVLSILPLVFLVARLLFAAIADYIGWSHLFLLINWPTAVASIICYYFASSIFIFMLGKFAEGLRESAYWAVIRTGIYSLAGKNVEYEATKNNAIIWLASAVGAAAAGMLIAYAGFSITIAVIVVVSLVIVVPAVMLWKSSVESPLPKTTRLFTSLNAKGRTRLFWLVSIALMFNSLAVYPTMTLLLPVFMDQELGYSYPVIGFLFMLFNIIAAAVTFITLKQPLNLRRAAFLTSISLVASSLLAFSGVFFAGLFLALAFVRGYGIGFFEHIIVKAAKDSKNLSVDIGFLHAPMRIAEFSSVLIAGFVVQFLGYGPLFVITGICSGVYAFLSLRILKTR